MLFYREKPGAGFSVKPGAWYNYRSKDTRSPFTTFLLSLDFFFSTLLSFFIYLFQYKNMADNNNPYSNNFLKNLSQKKYAWMEEANTITAPVVPSPPPTTKPQSPKKSVKKQKVSTEPTTLDPSTEKKTSPSPPSSQVMVDVKDSQEEKVSSTEPRKPQPRFKYTNFPVKGYNILPTRNITSTYGRNVTTYFPGHPAGAPEIAPNVSTWISAVLF